MTKGSVLASCVLLSCSFEPAAPFLQAGIGARTSYVALGSRQQPLQHHVSRYHHRRQHQRETVRCFFSFGGGAKKGPPANYDAIAAQAIAAVQAGLKSGEKAMEVEFPPLASLNKINDGSAKNRRLARENTLSFAKKLVGAIGKSKKAYVVCCQPGAKADFGIGVRGAADVRDINAKNLPPAKAGDVVVVVTPADQGQWKLAKKMAETTTVVIVNGVFVNGYVPFEPVYYFKPISGWGSVVRQYPGPFTAYLANSNKVVPCDAGLVKQGDIRRPDLRSAANALSAAFREQQGAA
ncbi:conserved unknown protein [Ectocarpus siliculosus]|uniref:DUF1995 domain-containing protein n=1 Tax=Ectocarpus siliculosus TaxID=2880 RepID=D7G642_ECTSI|nr:conserved unknown protein [Ectocarpus siliculosus]|eukprot:CBJ27451.1 conserved unknown protein [Ectocarpus siliculosus]